MSGIVFRIDAGGFDGFLDHAGDGAVIEAAFEDMTMPIYSTEERAGLYFGGIYP